MAVLVLNCGSSSLKLALIDPETGARSLTGLAERLGTAEATLSTRIGDGPKRKRSLGSAGHDVALAQVLEELREAGLEDTVEGVGHRVVHGGEAFTSSARIDDAIERAIEQCARLAPLHNPANLVGIRSARSAFPSLPQVAVFDTAFHQTMPPSAYRYAVPERWYTEHGVRRYGFHGTSHRYVAGEAARRLGRPSSEVRLLIAHLGNGCSAAAVAGGASVATTMGLTPLSGLVMGTRSGDIDPGLFAFIGDTLGLDARAVTAELNQRSGLLGVSGLSNDMRTLLEARASGHSGAELAIELFCRKLAEHLLALSAALDGLDALVFTGGIGENAPAIRGESAQRLWALNVRLDPERNEAHGGESGRIDRGDGTPVLVVPTDEEWMIARDTRAVSSH